MTQPKPQHPSGAAYHGLASLALAAALLLFAVPTLQLAYWLQLSDYKGFDDSGKRLVAYGGYLAAFFAIVLLLTSVVTGARGLPASDRTRRVEHSVRLRHLPRLVRDARVARLWIRVALTAVAIHQVASCEPRPRDCR
ncbi:MAG: hypothetical protein K8U57_22895 [Planctomycetes bacterium]|nr:hypothetical protein [Planctomycetota bacterium]